MKISSWNVNSIRIRQDQVTDWLRAAAPDVLCLQETKVVDDDFPIEAFSRLGYSVAFAGQKSYNGVAILSRTGLSAQKVGLDDDPPDADRRLLRARVGDLWVLSAYVPNGKSVASDAFPFKLEWLARLQRVIEALHAQGDRVVLVGDFNVAMDERDVHDPKAYEGKLLFHPDERAAMSRLLSGGKLADSLRLHETSGGHFSWWDYRNGSRPHHRGLRIDYAFISESLVPRCRAAGIDVAERWKERPSDHTPVWLELDL